jgi:hypothetical protein
VTELWDVSILALYSRVPQVHPSLFDLKLFSYEGGGDSDISSGGGASSSGDGGGGGNGGGQNVVAAGARADNDADYVAFKATAPTIYAKELGQQNYWDIKMYVHACVVLCD